MAKRDPLIRCRSFCLIFNTLRKNWRKQTFLWYLFKKLVCNVGNEILYFCKHLCYASTVLLNRIVYNLFDSFSRIEVFFFSRLWNGIKITAKTFKMTDMCMQKRPWWIWNHMKRILFYSQLKKVLKAVITFY